jgi:hypothetical protein
MVFLLRREIIKLTTKSSFLAFKSALMVGKDDKSLRKNLNKIEIDRAIKEVEIELRNKKFKIKDF